MIWMFAFVAIALWFFLAKGANINPLRAIPPYVNEVSIFPLYQLDESLDLPPQNQPQAKDLKLLKQAIAYWVDTDLSFDSTLYYTFDRNNPGTVSSLMAIRLFSDKKDPLIWTGFINPDQRSEHLYRGTSVVHYEQEGEPTCFFAVSKGILLFSFDQKQVERSIALMDEKAPNLFVYLKRRGRIDKNKPIRVLFNTGRPTEPNWHQMDWYGLDNVDSLSGTCQQIVDGFQEKLSRQGVVNFSSLMAALPDRIQLADMISIQDAGLFFSERDALGPQFWSARLQAQLGPNLAYVLEKGSTASFLIVSLDEPEKALEALLNMTDQNGLLEQFSYQAQQIYRSLAEDVSSPFFGDLYPEIKNPYWTIMDGFLVCSSDSDRLKIWMDYLLLQKNLSQSKVTEPFFSIMQEKSRRLVFWQAPLKQEHSDWWSTWTKKYPAGILSWNSERNLWKVDGKLSLDTRPTASIEILWRKDLFQSLEYGPEILKNPMTETVYGILVQNSDHRLELLNPEGVLLWSKELKSPVLGKVQAFEINPIEWGMIFNTRTNITKMDSNGNLLADWSMQVPASQGLELMVFEEPGDPHFFLPSDQQGIYGYNVLGDALINWNPFPLDYGFRSPVFHMASHEKDHLFWLDTEGRLRVKYRDGTDVEVPGLPQKILSLFFSKKNGCTYVLGEEGSIGSLNSELVYRPLAKKGQQVMSFSWMEEEGQVFLLKKDRRGIQRFLLEKNGAKQEMNLAYPKDVHRVDMVKTADSFWTFVQDAEKKQLSILDDSGEQLFPESIPCDGAFLVYKKEREVFLVTVLDGEVVVFGVYR